MCYCLFLVDVKHAGDGEGWDSARRAVQLKDFVASRMPGSSLSDFLKSMFEILGEDELKLKQVKRGKNKIYEFEGKDAKVYDLDENAAYYGSYQGDDEGSQPSPAPYLPTYNAQPASSPYYSSQQPSASRGQNYNTQIPHIPNYNKYQLPPQVPSYANQQPHVPNYSNQQSHAPSYANQQRAQPYAPQPNYPPNFVNHENYENFRFCGKPVC